MDLNELNQKFDDAFTQLIEHNDCDPLLMTLERLLVTAPGTLIETKYHDVDVCFERSRRQLGIEITAFQDKALLQDYAITPRDFETPSARQCIQNMHYLIRQTLNNLPIQTGNPLQSSA